MWLLSMQLLCFHCGPVPVRNPEFAFGLWPGRTDLKVQDNSQLQVPMEGGERGELAHITLSMVFSFAPITEKLDHPGLVVP